jgi:hypothetical protein
MVGARRQCHLLLFVPLSDTLSAECQIPCQPSDKQPVTRHYEELHNAGGFKGSLRRFGEFV